MGFFSSLFGDSETTTTSTTTGPVTTNTDRRQALSDAVSVGDGATTGDISRTNYTATMNIDGRQWNSSTAFTDASSRYSDDHRVVYAADALVLQTLSGTLPDAVKAMANAGADVIKSAGGSVVNLTRDSIAANSASFDSVVNFGSKAIDKLIDASVKTSQIGNDLAAKAVASYQPDSKNQADTAKYALYAAAALVGLVLITGKNA